jgi:hypothetical protein
MKAIKTTGRVTGKPFWIVQSVHNGKVLTGFGRTWSAAAMRIATRFQEGAGI